MQNLSKWVSLSNETQTLEISFTNFKALLWFSAVFLQPNYIVQASRVFKEGVPALHTTEIISIIFSNMICTGHITVD